MIQGAAIVCDIVFMQRFSKQVHIEWLTFWPKSVWNSETQTVKAHSHQEE